jgi:aspartyl-tRNA synthetase
MLNARRASRRRSHGNGVDMELEHFDERWKRTHRCGDVRAGDGDSHVVLAGWVKRVRELGGLTFVDLWDRSGIIQLVVEAENSRLHDLFHALRAEDVIACAGRVRLRPSEMVNRHLKTGEIEVIAERAAVLNRSAVPPFTVTSEVQANEDLRLRYRYLDLRREPLQRNLAMRHDLVLAARRYLSGEGFLEIETPMLVRRTPEGARDYLVPSRQQPGKFYALPQSPQLYKQILMVSGFDRYFQLARCLRDEDLRADRQPEHTQIDIEMSFVTEEDIFSVVERLMDSIWAATVGVRLAVPFPRKDYDEAMSLYGTDKPDVRFGLEIRDCSDIFRDGPFAIFRAILERGGVVRGIAFSEGAAFSRRQVGDLESIAKAAGAGGLVWVKCEESATTSSIAQFLNDDSIEKLRGVFSISGPALILLIGGGADIVARSLGELRLHIGKTKLITGAEGSRFVWVNRFPLFVPADGGGWEAAHHIFTMPFESDLSRIESDPGSVRGHLYDLVCNGTELGSGSIRVHRRELQERLFEVIGISREEADRRFGFLLEALQYGAPPHGGIALGVDRIAMLMAGGSSIRDFIAFPKTTSAAGLMEGSPSEIEPELLEELHIRVETDERRR